MPFCCEHCFGHPWLKDRVRELSTHRGTCDYCSFAEQQNEEGEENRQIEAAIVDVSELGEYFRRVTSMYTIPEYDAWELGEPLVWRIQWDWGVFDEDYLSEDNQVELLEDIVNSGWDDDDGEPPLDARELYMRGSMHHTSQAELWGEFVSAVRENPEEDIPLSYELDEALERARIEVPTGTVYYRARIGCEVGEYGEFEPFRGTEIGAPPAAKVTVPGRVNGVGESVLYCAEDEHTAIAEMRPPRGYLISTCSVTLNRSARILDLRESRTPVNPFVTDTPLWEYENDRLLDAFAEEMSLPLERDNTEHTHYLPCQRLAEYITEAGFDGIRYPSAMNDEGTNIVFFDPTIATIGESRLIRVTRTAVEYEREETGQEREQRMIEQFRENETETT